mmetsp:Transcript_17736/g.56702  ORF Transcript_17736/g.56702 Transcript_17736/m.56702 type:complete len:101 (+) Transcript_17736:718-1020(+)
MPQNECCLYDNTPKTAQFTSPPSIFVGAGWAALQVKKGRISAPSGGEWTELSGEYIVGAGPARPGQVRPRSVVSGWLSARNVKKARGHSQKPRQVSSWHA